MSKVSVATIWMDGCSGCHMSLLDMDERLIELADKIEIVYSPLVDNKDYPEHVDVAIIEGSVSYDEDFKKLTKIRQHTGVIIALGDCAVAGNVPTMRNPFPVAEVLERAYVENATSNAGIPSEDIPQLLPYVKPLHEVIDVDVFVQGCPPSADTIYYVITELIAGRTPDLTAMTRPGA